jgi:hypothetical protein
MSSYNNVVGESVAGYLHPVLGEALAARHHHPLAVAFVLLIALLHGSDQTVERAFRLLRWVANRPEPPSPDQHGPIAVEAGDHRVS